jgi:hypothetical protein
MTWQLKYNVYIRMSLKGGNYRGFVNEIETKLAQIEVVADALESDLSGSIADFKVEFQDLSAEFQDLSAQVNAGGSGVGEVIAAYPLGRAFEELNVEYVVEGLGKQDWSLTLAAGTYMFVFTPTAYLKGIDGSNPIWTSTNCNCEYLEYNLGNYELRMSIYPDLSVPVGEVGTHIKYLGKQTIIFTLATETTMGLTAKMSAPEIGVVVLDESLFGYTVSNISYVKLA